MDRYVLKQSKKKHLYFLQTHHALLPKVWGQNRLAVDLGLATRFTSLLGLGCCIVKYGSVKWNLK